MIFSPIGLTDLITGLEGLSGPELNARVKALQRHVSDLTVVIRQAADYLKDIHLL